MTCSRQTVAVKNDLGVHLRAAGALVQTAGKFESSIWLHYNDMKANAKSIMSVLSLAAACGAELEIVAEGPDAQDAVAALVELVDKGFDIR